RYFEGQTLVDCLTDPLRPVAQEAHLDGLHSLGDYELIDPIGQGGMGVVYKARDRKLGRLVALKMVLAGRWSTPAEMKPFRNQAETIAQLEHPHIIPIYEVGEAEGHLYFTMKLMEGSLAERIGEPRASATGVQREASEWFLAAGLVATVAQAVQFAHDR